MAIPETTHPSNARFPDTALRWALPFAALMFIDANGALAQSSVSPDEKSIIWLREKILQENSRREVADWEFQEYQVVLPGRFPANKPNSTQLVTSLTSDLHASYPNTEVLITSLNSTQRNRKHADEAKKWEAEWSRRWEFQQRVEAREQTDGFEWPKRSVRPYRFESLDLTFLVVGLCGVAFGAWRASRRFRIHFRRVSRARDLRAMAILVPFFLFSGCNNSEVRSWSDAEREELRNLLQNSERESTQAVAKSASVRKVLLDRWDIPESGQTDEIREILLGALVAEQMHREADQERIKLSEDETQLQELSRAGQRRHSDQNWIRAAAVILFLLAACAPYLLARWRERSRQHKQADTCPRCLATGKMKERRSEAAIIQCGGCGYRCPINTKWMARLCFPTVGIRSSGKTHLLASAYASVKNRATRTAASVQQSPSMGDEQFNTYIELILKQRATAGATVHDLPAPIVVCVRDLDRGGANTVLVNLFDYSGEMMTQSIVVDDLRRRAVKMDGFLMFFDPTQMYGDVVNGEATLALEDQLAALHQFYQDMLDARGLQPGMVVPVPVAVCISKFDLVATRSPMGGQARPFLHKLKAELDPPGELSLQILRERSRIVEQMLPFMLPGADLKKILREYFGSEFLFFPTTDRGLTGGGQGGPFGVVEPLLWLLHMHGYCVLNESEANR